MKKILMMLLAMLIAMPMAVTAKTQLEKERDKEYKKTMKAFKKEGWKIFGTARSLEVALLTHYDKLNTKGDDAIEIMSTAKAKSKNVLRTNALNNACIFYSSQAGSHLKGRMVSDMFGDENNIPAEFSKFYGAFETLVEKEIKGELKESFSVFRELGDGTFEIQSFYIVDQDAATAARLRAYENAMRESEAAQKYAEKVADFVREGFKPE